MFGKSDDEFINESHREIEFLAKGLTPNLNTQKISERFSHLQLPKELQRSINYVLKERNRVIHNFDGITHPKLEDRRRYEREVAEIKQQLETMLKPEPEAPVGWILALLAALGSAAYFFDGC